MPILKSLPSWPCPQDSLGRQIPSSRVGKRLVWWPRGPALEVFEQEIQPEIESLLTGIDLGYADLFIRLYMMGRGPEVANPYVMLCCTNDRARKDAEATVRESQLLSKHPGFGLGAAALPIEHHSPIRRMADQEGIAAMSGSGYAWEATLCVTQSMDDQNIGKHVRVWSTLASPHIGREIGVFEDEILRSATGGVIISIGMNFYQLTVGHVFEGIRGTASAQTDCHSLNACHFDGQSDSEEDDLDSDSETLGWGSITSKSTKSNTESSTEVNLQNSYEADTTADEMDAAHPIGYLPEMRQSSPLDYILVPVSKDEITKLGSKFNQISQENATNQFPYVLFAAQVGAAETNIVIAASDGVFRGVLLPGAIAYRRTEHAEFQRVFQVHVSRGLVSGDCGSAVLDQRTGGFYGHIVMGVPDSRIGYMVPATAIFEDIRSKSSHAVAVATTTDSQVSSDAHSQNLHVPSVSTVSLSRTSSSCSLTSGPSSRCNSVADCCSENAGIHLPCEFSGHTKCKKSFHVDDFDQWTEHIVSVHLRNQLPEQVSCWFCDGYFFDAQSNRARGDIRLNFEDRMWHIRNHIVEGGMTQYDIRPDPHLRRLGDWRDRCRDENIQRHIPWSSDPSIAHEV
ncbi:hypothetical protein F5Y18DRAFT_204540 [Xylariaceae sp. FL1019]|nr:hypothetical protein F5Y18DRAFT_204540 [Xylariaceae sp. FL1019]